MANGADVVFTHTPLPSIVVTIITRENEESGCALMAWRLYQRLQMLAGREVEKTCGMSGDDDRDRERERDRRRDTEAVHVIIS